MCGIVAAPGAFGATFSSALDALAWRGPDGYGSLTIHDYTIACRRLAITDANAGQPLVLGEDGQRLAIVFNGSLAGVQELSRDLAAVGEAPASANDAELPLRLWRAWGLAGLRQLEGQFAFVLVDEAEQRVVVGRDEFGEKPLFVDPRAQGLPRVASSVAALMRVAPAERSHDALALARFAHWGWTEHRGGVFGLPYVEVPTGALEVYSAQGLEERVRLLRPEDCEFTPEVTIDDLLWRAVSRRLHGDRPLGLFLSGGVDSSCLAVVLRELAPQARCLSLDFGAASDEGSRASRIAGVLGLEHVRSTIDASALDALPQLVRNAGVPLGDPSIIAVHELSRVARDHGVGIVFSGEGGDDFFLGYRRQRGYEWSHRIAGFAPRVLRRGLQRVRGSSAWSRFWRASGSDRYTDLLAVSDPVDVARCFDIEPEAICARSALDFEASMPHADPDYCGDDARVADRSLYLRYDLCPKLDIGGLAAGVEARAPMLDRQLFAWCLQHVHHSGERSDKLPLRGILAGALPRELREGRKLGFAPPLGRWLKERAWVRERLGDADAGFDRSRALYFYDELDVTPQRAHLVYNLLALAIWNQEVPSQADWVEVATQGS